MSDKTITTPEAKVIINGRLLTDAQSMTLRVAIEDFAQSLVNEGLGDDEHGQRMKAAYLDRIAEIRETLYAKR
jgi:hypothetical protein